jgi:2-desacetyl-2-hydroxyethyl bacteriochlorophyllide A dehydrogenase
MKAYVLTGPREGGVQEVDEPVVGPGQVLVEVARVGVCGTDVEFFTGEMPYLKQGHAEYPIRLGHEWCGKVVAAAGDLPDGWVGLRVTGETMLGCGKCERCRAYRQHVCENRVEVGIRGGFAGALAERLVVPASSLFVVPGKVDDLAGAMVEPGGNALRAVEHANVLQGNRVLILGLGTIGLLAGEFARSRGVEVHLADVSESALEFARTRGFAGVTHVSEIPSLRWDAVIDASNAASVPALALDLVEPGKKVVYIGLAGTPSMIDTRQLALKDVTAVGILSGTEGMAGAIELYGRGSVDPAPLVSATVSLAEVGDALAGHRPFGGGPKIHVDPRLPC